MATRAVGCRPAKTHPKVGDPHPVIPRRIPTALVRWFRKSRRELAWREFRPDHTRDPYRTWVAEIMLQQTRVEAVTGHYQRWLARFPDLQALARAGEAEVLRHWAGLGYYARARHLHQAARLVLSKHGGVVPNERAALLALPGVGKYTAGAILSLAFNRPEPILDGNLVRVFARFHGISEPPKSASGSRAFWAVASQWVITSVPALVNEALMELGALLCRPVSPACEACPLRADCNAHAKGLQARLPRREAKRKPELIRNLALVAKASGRVLLRQASPGDGILRGQMIFPMLPEAGGCGPMRVARALGLPRGRVAEIRPAGMVHHAITCRRFVLRVLVVELKACQNNLEDTFQWLPARGLNRHLTNSLTRKIWERAGTPVKLQGRGLAQHR